MLGKSSDESIAHFGIWFSLVSSLLLLSVCEALSSATSNCHRSTTSLVSFEMIASTNLDTLPARSHAR